MRKYTPTLLRRQILAAPLFEVPLCLRPLLLQEPPVCHLSLEQETLIVVDLLREASRGSGCLPHKPLVETPPTALARPPPPTYVSSISCPSSTLPGAWFI